MEVPLEIGFHNLQSTEWADTLIRERAAKLDALYSRLTACRVRIEGPHGQHRNGKVASVHIEMSVPGKTLMVSREPHRSEQNQGDPDLARAIRDAFDAAERQLKTFKAQLGGDLKAHGVPLHGQITQINPEDDHGFLLTPQGGQLYFHRNSVLNGDFDDLKRGDAVHYIETVGDTGPVASKVRRAAEHTGA